jgi:hypothetical protein
MSAAADSPNSGRAVGRLAVWLARNPLALCLPAQAALLLVDLAHLPVWGDEAASLSRAVLPAAELRDVLRGNVHPLLYFQLLGAWLELPLDATPIVRARALSALCVLASTLVVDRCWARRLDPASRWWLLAVWTLSPALLLYGRMARSYGLQLLLACLALHAGQRYVARTTAAPLVAYAAAVVLLLHIHYLPGIAVAAGVTFALLRQGARRPDLRSALALLAPVALIGAAIALWTPPIVDALRRVAAGTPYHALGNAWTDAAIALAYTAVSATVGETFHPWMLPAVAAVTPAAVLLAVRGGRTHNEWLGVVLPAAIVGFAGAVQWVSYAFVASRLLFLLPFYLLLVVSAGRVWPRARAVTCGAMLCLSAAAIAMYFQQVGFLNKAYVIPGAEIGRIIRERSSTARPAVLLDNFSTNLIVLLPDLPADAVVMLIADSNGAAEAAQSAEPGGPDLVWFARNARDSSPEGLNRRVEDAFAPRFTISRTGFVPYTALDRAIMAVAGWPVSPRYVIELLEMRRRP